ncbi:MAG: hypothetical protein A2144_03240 [Chloroflexi bacterium RBG_16_50_9]|nr:MAG: hypothetical protein A2144_03240 [Chloroflexi bacterium RBG_16_50_9]
MGELEYKENNDDWAFEKGIKKKCPKGHEYDSRMASCPMCSEAQEIEEYRTWKEAAKHRKKENDDKERKLTEAFERIVWPSDKSLKKSLRKRQK